MIPRIIQLLDVGLVVKHLAIGRVIKAFHQLNNGRLSAARLPHEGHHLILVDLNRNAFNNLHVTFGWIVEFDVFQLDRPLGSGLY